MQFQTRKLFSEIMKKNRSLWARVYIVRRRQREIDRQTEKGHSLLNRAIFKNGRHRERFIAEARNRTVPCTAPMNKYERKHATIRDKTNSDMNNSLIIGSFFL